MAQNYWQGRLFSFIAKKANSKKIHGKYCIINFQNSVSFLCAIYKPQSRSVHPVNHPKFLTMSLLLMYTVKTSARLSATIVKRDASCYLKITQSYSTRKLVWQTWKTVRVLPSKEATQTHIQQNVIMYAKNPDFYCNDPVINTTFEALIKSRLQKNCIHNVSIPFSIGRPICWFNLISCHLKSTSSSILVY